MKEKIHYLLCAIGLWGACVSAAASDIQFSTIDIQEATLSELSDYLFTSAEQPESAFDVSNLLSKDLLMQPVSSPLPWEGGRGVGTLHGAPAPLSQQATYMLCIHYSIFPAKLSISRPRFCGQYEHFVKKTFLTLTNPESMV